MVTPGYDKAGNMIGIPNPTISSTATYDAWNRLIGVTDASTSITNDYDARGFRITETTGGVGDIESGDILVFNRSSQVGCVKRSVTLQRPAAMVCSAPLHTPYFAAKWIS